MTKEEERNAFEPFYRARNEQSENLNPNGNHVGLSICKQICKSLGGDISVISVPDRGSQFTFTMKVFDDQHF